VIPVTLIEVGFFPCVVVFTCRQQSTESYATFGKQNRLTPQKAVCHYRRLIFIVVVLLTVLWKKTSA